MSDPHGQNPYGQNPYGQSPYGQDPYGQQPPTGPTPYGQDPYSQPAYAGPGHPGHPGGVAPYASWGRRVGAYLVDGILPAVLYAIAGIVVVVMSETTTQSRVDPLTGQATVRDVSEPTGAGLAVALLLYALAVAFVIWNQWIRQGRTGYSLGKQALGIKLVKDGTDTPPGIGLNIGRSFAHVLDALPCYLGFLWPLFDAKNRTWADMICSTTVVLRPRA